MMLIMAGLLVLLAGPADLTTEGCTATTDIPEFKKNVHKACGSNIRAVSLTGDHRTVRLVITYAADMLEKPVGSTFQALAAQETAIQMHSIMLAVYDRLAEAPLIGNEPPPEPWKLERFIVRFEDVEHREICKFGFVGKEKRPSRGYCMSYVEGP